MAKQHRSDIFFIRFRAWNIILNSDDDYRPNQEETFLVERKHIVCDFESSIYPICLLFLHMRIPSEFQLKIATKIYRFAVLMPNKPHNIGRKLNI